MATVEEPAGESAAPAPPKARRRRRSRQDVAIRIRSAARELFAERGYAAATTREIAIRADVSETLLFRYFGDKAKLFAEVVTAPFHRLMEHFLAPKRDAGNGPVGDMAREFTMEVYGLLETNRDLFRALLLNALVDADGGRGPAMGGLPQFFQRSVDHVGHTYAEAEQSPPIDLSIGVRLGFGMILSSVLLRDALFTEPPAREHVIEALQYMVSRTLVGPPSP